VDAVEIPVIADGETGFGGELNVARTVKEFERAGAAAIHIEDAMIPKRPAHLGFTSPAISRQEYVDKIRAALDARTDESLMIVARTSVDMELQEKIERLQECVEVGADAFFNSVREKEGIVKLSNAVKKPGMGVLYANMTLADYGSYGVKCAIIPNGLAIAALCAQDAYIRDVARSGDSMAYFKGQSNHNELRDFYLKQGME
jgi:2-methylisocitrate lyase-like PEP mutase family enzyme